MESLEEDIIGLGDTEREHSGIYAAVTDLSSKRKELKDHEKSNDDLRSLSSQLWAKDPSEITYADMVQFGGLAMVSALFCDFITKVMNSIEIENHEVFLEALEKSFRDKQGLLTVLNHTHYTDDPLIHVALLKMSYLDSWKAIIGNYDVYHKWKSTPAEKRNFFYHRVMIVRKIFRWFFGMTRTVPILRGQGIEQDSFQVLIKMLQRGDWVSIFGEGTRTRVHGVLNDFKPGIGALIYGSPDSIVLPIGHDGLHRVSPMGAAADVIEPMSGEVLKQAMRTNQKIHVVVGEPMSFSKLAREVSATNEGYMVLSNEVRRGVARCFNGALANAEAAQSCEGWSERAGLFDLSSIWTREMR